MKLKTIRQRMLNTTMIGGAALMALTAAPVMMLVAPTEALAQTQTGALRVTVTGSDGGPLVGATVTASSPDSLVTRTGVTDATGSVRLSGLDPATNYTVTVAASGYETYSAQNVAVVTGRDLSVGYVLVSGAQAGSTLEDIVVTGRSLAAVDVTSATVSTTLTLDVVESLPTGRNYQSYLQLVPGVKPSNSGNPSSRSGVNYSDIGGVIGTSTDNVYYLDGIDVTDSNSGTFGANFNSEIIQEQQVLVSAIPAEYAGGSGLVSRVITKSGGNEWHGSINYYLQNDDLVAPDEHSTSGGFSTYDTAFTLGGPILRDRLWIFGSYQKKNREDEVLNPTTGAVRRTVTNDAEYGFAKLTWQITNDDRLSVSYFNDPTEISGSSNPTVLNNRDSAQQQGGDNYKVDYTRTWGDLLVNGYWFRHEGEVSSIAADQSVRDTVSYRGAAAIELRNLGGAGTNSESHRDREEFGLNLEYYLDTGFGTHTFKAGYSNTENVLERNNTVPGGATYTSIALPFAGRTYADFTTASSGWTTRPFDSGARGFIVTAANADAAARAVLDTNRNGTVEAAEVDAYAFTSTAGNPYGNVNAYRALRTVDAPYSVKSEGQAVYLQDTWTYDRLTVNLGARAEKWTQIGSGGQELFTFDWDIAPRLSTVYDVFGDGRSKVFGFAGRYYDPIRTNITDFAGNLSGPVTAEQIYIGNQWLTFRTRGGAVVPDSVFSPTTKTPYTDEFVIGGSTTLGNSIGLSGSITHRRTRDIFEDYDLALYSDPTCTQAACGTQGIAFPGSLFYLPYEYFGYTSKPNANYVLGTLAGGKRDYTGFEVTLTKFKTDNWQGQMSYTYNSATGNTNSDGNADYQGDLIFLDPRAPNADGPTPGNIRDQFKAYGSYDFDFGLQVSAVFAWNSGAIYTPAAIVGGRYFAPTDPAYTFGGVTDTYLQANRVGSETGPSYYELDMRFKYVADLQFVPGEVELFLDVFNVLDAQSATRVMPVLAGDGIYAYQEANAWVAPRRAYLGVRYSF